MKPAEQTQEGGSSELPTLTIYTDGACSPNPGPGGWGAVILDGERVVSELSRFGGDTTNNRMELTAAVAALKSVATPHSIVLFTDSQYVRNGITSWIETWRRNNWQTADRKPVKNSDLWQELLKETQRHEVRWKWVRGHGRNRWNNRADELAVAGRRSGGGEVEKSQADTQPEQDAIHLYLGVTCKHKSGAGGWAVILTWRNHVRILGSKAEKMTANQLYIHAVISGLEGLKKKLPVHVHTHSGYLRDGAVSWLGGWQRRNWRTKDGGRVGNRELWQRLAELLGNFEVRFLLEDREHPSCFASEAKELAREFEQGDCG